MLPMPLDVRKFAGISMMERLESLLCLLSYFTLTANTPPREGEIMLTRKSEVKSSTSWRESTSQVSVIQHTPRSRVEKDTSGSLLVAFPDPQMGGSALYGSNTQMGLEEITLCLYPESLVGALVCMPGIDHSLLDGEAVVVQGVERFSEIEGRHHNFKWLGDVQVATGVRNIACMDPSPFPIGEAPRRQYRSEALCRECNKACCAFKITSPDDGVSTGEWGTGVKGGDPDLKAVVQWLAASEAGMLMNYHSYGPEDDKRGLSIAWLAEAAREANITVGTVWGWLVAYGDDVSKEPPPGQAPVNNISPPRSPLTTTQPDGLLIYLLKQIPGGELKFAAASPIGAGLDEIAEQDILQEKLAIVSQIHYRVEEAGKVADEKVNELRENISVLQDVKNDSKDRLVEERTQEILLQGRDEYYTKAYTVGKKSLSKAQNDLERCMIRRGDASQALRIAEEEVQTSKKTLRIQEEVQQKQKVKLRELKSLLKDKEEVVQAAEELYKGHANTFSKRPATVSKAEESTMKRDIAKASEAAVHAKGDLTKVRKAFELQEKQVASEASKEAKCDDRVAAANKVRHEARSHYADCVRGVEDAETVAATQQVKLSRAKKKTQETARQAEKARTAANRTEEALRLTNVALEEETDEMRQEVTTATKDREISSAKLLEAIETQKAYDETCTARNAVRDVEAAKRKNDAQKALVAESQAFSAKQRIKEAERKKERELREQAEREEWLASKKEKAKHAEQQQKVREANQRELKTTSDAVKASKIKAESLDAQIHRLLKGESARRKVDIDEELGPLQDDAILSFPAHAMWTKQEIFELIEVVRYCQARGIWKRHQIFRACEESEALLGPAQGVAREAKNFSSKWVQLVAKGSGVPAAIELEAQWRRVSL